MLVRRLNFFIVAGVALAGASAAQAADYTPPPPPPVYAPPPQPEPCCDTWYLRGFVGAGINSKSTLDVTPMPADTNIVSNSLADSYFIGGAVGYNWNSWLRFDLSAEYRAKSHVTALISSQPGGSGPVAVDQYEGSLSSWVVLANAFIDLGTWDCWTPFVGAGIGGAYNTISNFTDVTPNVDAFGATGSSFGVGRGTSTWNVAWALYAGVSYQVTKNFNIDLTYRYLNYGKAKETVDCNGASGCNDFEFKDLHSNDIMLGLRWTCCETTPPAPRYVQPYVQPPVYTEQPPLRSRG
ncbi:MAG TPA: outer membrane beta-barrel protein [Pseudolabrys sp.]|nr:outer membrane beta-barrel protein [Pseudolabrys sp.]